MGCRLYVECIQEEVYTVGCSVVIELDEVNRKIIHVSEEVVSYDICVIQCSSLLVGLYFLGTSPSFCLCKQVGNSCVSMLIALN